MSTDIIMKATLNHDAFPLRGFKGSETSGSPSAYQNLKVVKRISKGRFPVYLTSSKITNEKYVMKVFVDGGSDEYYENEIRFASLSHPNIINVIDYEKERSMIHKGRTMGAAYILSEYAPYGDFFDFITAHKNELDAKLARTYFRQLIEGLEYLHSLGVSHLDIKPENLLIGADFNLKIADFDLSYVDSDDKIISRGTRYYRAPELYNSSSSNVELDNAFAADIYSAGIMLFIMKSGGVYPHAENLEVEGVNYTELMHKNSSKFWANHCKIQGKQKSFFESSFKDLFHKMVTEDSKKRITIKKIKQSKWYKGPVYSPEELLLKMKTILKY